MFSTTNKLGSSSVQDVDLEAGKNNYEMTSSPQHTDATATSSLPRPDDRRPAALQGLDIESQSTNLEHALVLVSQPDVEVLTAVTPNIVTPSSNNNATSPAQAALHVKMAQKGVSLTQLNAIATELHGRFEPSKSQGLHLASLNDHVGVLSIPFRHYRTAIMENLAVIKDKVLIEGVEQERYFVKGHANRLISANDLLKFEDQRPRYDARDKKDKMETSFRSFLKDQSSKSELFARRSYDEAATPVMPVPPNAMPLPLRQSWANAENFMAKGFGPHPMVNGESSAFHLGYADYNAIENRIVIFLTDTSHHTQARPMQPGQSKKLPASLNIDGGTLAEIQGISTVEVMGPAGVFAGVKLASLRALLHSPQDNMRLRVTTEDGAIHHLDYTPQGLQMKLVQPKAAGASIMSPLPNTDISLYGYQGRNTGLYGSISGYANPELILSTGEHILTGPLLFNRSGFEGKARAIGNLIANLVTLTPTFGMTSSRVTGAINTTLRAASVASVVYGMNTLVESLRDPKTHTLLGGANAFSSVGSGTVNSNTLAGAIAFTVVAQEVLTIIFDFAHKNLLKDSFKSKETIGGQIFNEAVMPLGSEFLRLSLNYGIQTSTGLPRGNAIDVATLLGVAGLHTAIGVAQGRSGESANHPIATGVYDTIDFFVADLLFRSLGATAGSKKLKTYNGLDYAEALVTRLTTRGIDKWFLPILATVMSAAGLIGPNARAYHDQVTQENRYKAVDDYLRDFTARITKAGTKLLDRAEEGIKKDVEALAGTIHSAAVMLEHVNKLINRIDIKQLDHNPLELVRVQTAANFSKMSEEDQVTHLNNLTQRFEGMIEASRQAEESRLTLESEAGPSTAAVPEPSVGTTLAVSNSTSQLPDEMQTLIESLIKSFEDTYDTGNKDGKNYPVSVPPDFLSDTLPHFAQASITLGVKTDRLRRMITTFSDVPAKYIANIHNAMEAVQSVPESVSDSDPFYRRLTPAMLRAIRNAIVKYTEESGPFHYLLRWAQTGQDHFVNIVPGVPMRIAMMNRRNNTSGDPDQRISGLDPLYVNLGALHAKKFPAIVQRAVVTDAIYRPKAIGGNDNGLITEGERVSLTEILSTTSAEQLTAAFLAALGYGAAPMERRLKIVFNQDSAINIAKFTDLMQAESISLPGALFIVTRIDSNPPPASEVVQGKGKAKASEPVEQSNLGQVVYMDRINTYTPETTYRDFKKEKEKADKAGTPVSTNLQDGALGIDPRTGHFYQYNSKANDMEFVVASKSYFLGTELETNPNQKARWRYPYTSPTSPAEIRRSIRVAMLMGDDIMPFLNDAIRNVHLEVDRKKGSYYEPGNIYKQEDDARLAQTKADAQPAILNLNGLSMTHPFPASELSPQAAFPGELLARVASTILMKPLMMLEIDAAGKVKTQKVRTTNSEGNVVEKDEPVKLAHFTKTHDDLDMTWEPSGPSMIGVGPNGYYAMGYLNAELIAAPVRINGNGLTAGNLLHAIAATSFPNPNHSRYTLRNGEVRSATEVRQHIPGIRRSDEVNRNITQLLEKFKRFASAGYEPMDEWMAATYADVNGRAVAPAPAA